MARLSTYTKDVNLTGKDMLTGSNYVTTVNGIDQFETNNFTLKKLSDYFIGQITGDPSQLSLKPNGGIVYETVNDTNYLAVNLSHTNITGQLANSDLVNSTITINSTIVPLGGSIDIPVGDITAVNAGTYLNGGGETGDVTLNHDTTSRSDTTASSTITSTFTAITSITSNATGHITSEETTTYTLPTDIYVDSAAVTGTTTKTITLGRTGGQSNITADFTDNDNYADNLNITGDTTKTVTIGRTGSLLDLTATFDDNDNYVDSITVTEPTSTTKRITIGRTGSLVDLTADFTDNDTIPNDATITLSAGTYISGGGNFTTDQSANETITFNHDNTTRADTTSSVGPNHGADFTVIDTLTSNATGHITAANVKTVTLPNGANDNTITLSAGTYLSGGGDFTVDQSFDETLTINHDATTRSDTTSTVSPAHGADFTAIDSVTTNATGHITSVNLKTITLPNDNNTDILQRISADSTNAERYVTFVDSATGNLEAGSDATFRFNPSTDKLTVTNLEVTGTQTINNVEVINTSGGIVFEGTSNDANETTLNVINPTADRAINLPNKSGTVALLDDIPTVNDGTLTVQGSSGLTGSGTFTANDADSPTITILHADTSSQPSVNNANNDFIQDIILDDYGHVTSITSATAQNTVTQIREDNGSYRTGNITLQSGTNVTITEPSTGVFNFAATNTQPNNGLLDINQGSGISLAITGGDFTADKATTTTIGISHADTSSQSSVDNTGNTFIQDITLDTYGHVTGLNSATVSIGNGTLTVQGTGALGGSGTFTANQSGNTTISISHDDTSALNGTYGSTANNTKIDTITVDAYGHVTAVATGPIDDNNNIDYINSASFNTGNGILTLSGVGNAGASVDLDGRYLTSYTETSTLANVVSRGNTSSGTLRVNGSGAWLTAEGNVGGTNPPMGQGLAFGWNRSNGSRESEILFHGGTSTHSDGELYIRSWNGSSYVSVAKFEGTGNTTFSGNVNAENTGSSYIRKAYDSSRYAQLESNSSGGALNLTHTSSTRVLLRSYADCYFINAGQVGFGTTSPTYPIHVTDQVSNTSIYASYDIVAYSDERVKEDIQVIPNALEKVSNIRGVTFKRKDADNENRMAGVIAQEIEKVLPEVVKEDKDGNKAVAYGNVVSLLIEAIKELEIKVKKLEDGSTK